MKTIRLAVVVLFTLCCSAASAQKSIKAYIKKYEGLAKTKMEQYAIPASIILGTSIVESAAGQSLICKSLNNFFGIKGKNKSSQKKMGYKSGYREYASDTASFNHFCQVLANKRFYTKLKGTVNYKTWLNSMNTAEYATAKQTWIKHITQVIEKYDLHKLDTPTGGADAAKN